MPPISQRQPRRTSRSTTTPASGAAITWTSVRDKSSTARPEPHVTCDSCAGFWGSYHLDERAGQIVYRPAGAVNPTLMGQELKRGYELNGDRLIITAPASEPNAKGSSRWVWERVPPVENLSPFYRTVLGFWEHVVEKRVNLTTGAVLSEKRP